MFSFNSSARQVYKLAWPHGVVLGSRWPGQLLIRKSYVCDTFCLRLGRLALFALLRLLLLSAGAAAAAAAAAAPAATAPAAPAAAW